MCAGSARIGSVTPRAIWLDHGRIAADGETEQVISDYLTMTAGPEEGLIDLSPPTLLLDAAALTCAKLSDLASAASRRPLVLTPHYGEMARLMDCSPDVVAANPAAMVREIVRLTNAVVALKGSETWIGGPGVSLLHYTGGCPGLGIGGSGDVLAGIIGGLIARGTLPFVATAWGVALHGAAGRQAAQDIGTTGFLARELLPRLPRLLDTL